jgi:hypothetical protein
MADTSEGMGLGTKALIGIGLVIAAAYGLPYIFDLAAENPEGLRHAARRTREVRERAIAATRRTTSRGLRYLAEKAEGASRKG